MKNLITASLTTCFILASGGALAETPNKKSAQPGKVAAPTESQAKPDTGAIAKANFLLPMQLDTCTTQAKIVFIQLQSGTRPDVAGLQECISKGKADVKTAYDVVKESYSPQKPPAELIEWRLEWTAAFDTANPIDSDTERTYLQRIGVAKQKAERANAKLDIAIE